MDVLRVVRHKVWHMHASDRLPGQYAHSVIGEGSVKFDPIFASLAEIGYAGYVSLEDNNPEGDWARSCPRVHPAEDRRALGLGLGKAPLRGPPPIARPTEGRPGVMEPICQVSLDLMTVADAMPVAEVAVRRGVDWLEAGTP